jgi:hypothetical protein
MAMKEETLQGFVVDLACLRKCSPHEWRRLGPEHTRKCALMGHCIESGFGLVADDGHVALLEPAATTTVVERLRQSTRERGIWLRVRREEQDGEMRTTAVDEG